MEEENARLRREIEALGSAAEQRQIREEQIRVDIPSLKGSVRSERLSPKDPDTSTPLPCDKAHNINSDDLEDAESSKLGFNGLTGAISDGQYPTTTEPSAASQVDMYIKTQLLAEAAKQRRLLLIALISARIVALM